MLYAILSLSVVGIAIGNVALKKNVHQLLTAV